MPLPSLPNWFDSGKVERRDRNKRSARQEREHAKANDGKVQRGSGSSWRAPQDVVTPDRMDQLKFTDKTTFSVDGRELLRVLRDATNAGRDAGFVLEFSKLGIRLNATIEETE